MEMSLEINSEDDWTTKMKGWLSYTKGDITIANCANLPSAWLVFSKAEYSYRLQSRCKITEGITITNPSKPVFMNANIASMYFDWVRNAQKKTYFKSIYWTYRHLWMYCMFWGCWDFNSRFHNYTASTLSHWFITPVLWKYLFISGSAESLKSLL